MHYCVLLITEKLPSKSEVDRIMQPYCYDNIEYNEETDELLSPYPLFTWDWYQIGGRYSGFLKLKVDDNDEDYKWGFYDREGRNERLFYSSMLSKIKRSTNDMFFHEEDYYTSMGIRDDCLYVDSAKIDDLLNFEELNCYICIDSDGKAIARESWDGNTFVKDEQFDSKFTEIKQNSKGKSMFVTVIDIHD